MSNRIAVRFILALLAGAACAQENKKTEMVAMRDGVRLATDVYLPQGQGPWPVVLERTPYNRKQQAAKAGPFVANGYGMVIQDWRGHFDSEGKFTVDVLTGTRGPEDGYDTVEWIASQPWSNGKVGVSGGSGPGIAAKQTVAANPPHLVAAVTGVAGIHPEEREFEAGGVPGEQSDRWLSTRGAKIDLWPRPRSFVFTPAGLKWPRDRSREAEAGRIAVLDRSGWYDSSCTASFNDFMALRGKNNRLIMAAKAHGAFLAGGLKYPPQDLPGTSAIDWFDYWLKGKPNRVMDSPPIRYFLMGDTMDPKAPGNVWKQAGAWPVPSKPRTFYLTAAGGLDAAAPKTAEGKTGYAYDPKTPAPTIGGPNLGQNNGPQDQRKLRGRPDVAYFTTEPLAAPIEVTGRGSLTLYFSADVTDTSIMVKLIDIYPNGYEALQLDQAYMARFRNGFDKPSPLEKGKVYKLEIPLLDIGLVFNKGHRIGVIVTGSNSPRFENHPNSYAPVTSYDNAPVAHVSIHASKQHASRLVLPEIQPAIPKTWTDPDVATLEVPLANPKYSPVHVSADEYYRIPARVLYKSYPVYHPDRQPAGYMEWLRKQEPAIAFDAERFKTREDWIQAGEVVFNAPTSHNPVFFSAENLRDPAFYRKAGMPVAKDGSVLFARWVVRKKGEVELGSMGCGTCHTRVMPDGTVVPGAQGNNPGDREGALMLRQAAQAGDPEKILQRMRGFARQFEMPWLPDDPNRRAQSMSLDELIAAGEAIPPGVTARSNTSMFFPPQIPDLIGVEERRYLDHTGLVRHRGVGDLMRYSSLAQDVFTLDRYGDSPPPRASHGARYSDEQLYALALYLYSLKPPPNPNRVNALASRGKAIFERERCGGCHTPPLYTNNKLVPADGFEPPADHMRRFDVMPARIGVNPSYALETHKGTGYYKVPSLKGVWYRGPFEHNGSVATLEDSFDPARLRADYVPTGFKGYDGKTRSVQGHRFGLNLPPEEKSALIAFLKTL